MTQIQGHLDQGDPFEAQQQQNRSRVGKNELLGQVMGYAHSLEIEGSVRAAETVVRIVLDLLGPIHSVVDLGGGTGSWCRAFKSLGVEQVLCLDHPDARSEGLLIHPNEFRAVDLSWEKPAPIPADLAVSLEFAEHVSRDRSEWIVEFLTRSSPIVLFSAAAPCQSGVGHVNEQWPSFWAALFARHGFAQLDVVRPIIINDKTIPFWYRQNLFIYVSDSARFNDLPVLSPPDFLCLHETVVRRLEQPTLKNTLRRLGPALWAAVRYRLRHGGLLSRKIR